MRRFAALIAIVAALAAAGWFFVQRPAEVQQQARTPTKPAPAPEKVAEAPKPPPEKAVRTQKPAAKKPAPETTAEEERVRLEATQAAERAAAEMAAERRHEERAKLEEKRRSASAADVSAGSSEALFEQAAALEREGNGAEAVKLYVRAARAGSAKAAKRLGEIYDKGIPGVSRDYAESLKWYNAARVLGEDVPMAKSRGEGPPAPVARPTPAPRVASETLERYPALEAPDRVVRDKVFSVQVSLGERAITPEVAVRAGPGIASTPQGSVSIPVPASDRALIIDVVLTAHGFVLLDGTNLGRITLPRSGDSSVAAFKLKADPAFQGPSERTIHATFSHGGLYLARVSRSLRVAESGDEHAQPSVQRSPAPLKSTALAAEHRADLTLVVLDGAAPGKSGPVDVVVLSPWLQPEQETVSRPADLEAWVHAQYEKILAAQQRRPAAEAPARSIPLLDGFGIQLYDGFAPASFRRAYARLTRQLGATFQSVQIITNNPALPWELMRPLAANGQRADFLGATHRVARWHLASGTRELPAPVQSLFLKEIVAIAPRYGSPALPAQARELDAVRKLRGTRVIDGRLKTVSELFRSRPDGIIHFTGHGSASRTPAGVFDYVIRLEDAMLDVTTWRGIAGGAVGRGALVFFNACEVGQASRVARFVEGWAPAMLEAGASAYIGGLWPLRDSGAADFAARFYQALGERTASGQAVVADLLRANRRLFRETGDPTFLAYVMYGDVNLHLTRAAP